MADVPDVPDVSNVFGSPMQHGMHMETQDASFASARFPCRSGMPGDCPKLVKHTIENEMLNGEVIRWDEPIRPRPK